MQESKLLGTLLPSSPDFQPIIRSMREKYGLPELSADDDPIEHVTRMAWKCCWKTLSPFRPEYHARHLG